MCVLRFRRWISRRDAGGEFTPTGNPKRSVSFCINHGPGTQYDCILGYIDVGLKGYGLRTGGKPDSMTLFGDIYVNMFIYVCSDFDVWFLDVIPAGDSPLEPRAMTVRGRYICQYTYTYVL